MFGLNKNKSADEAQEQLGNIVSLFGEEGKAEGFDPFEAVEGLISVRDGVQRVANLFGEKAKAEGFNLINAVKSSLDTNSKVLAAFGDDAKKEGFNLSSAIASAIGDQKKLSQITAAFGETAEEDGFDVVAAVKADRKNIEETDGEERTVAERQGGGDAESEKLLKEFYSETDAEVDRAIDATKEA